MRYVIFSVAAALALWLLDYYVYRNWRRFARYRRLGLRAVTKVFGVLVYVMPLTLPVYLYLFRWWEVEPKVARAMFVGFWAMYYLPKLPIAVVLLLKDGARLIDWQFHWLKRRQTTTDGMLQGHRTSAPDLTDLRTMSRAEFLQKMGWTAASVPFVVVGYGVFRSLYNFQIHEEIVHVHQLPRALDGLRIAQISDLHAGSFFSAEPLREAVSHVNALRPDLVTFSGDFVNHDAGELRDAISHLNQLSSGIGAFACLGNHDHYARVQDVVRGVAETPFSLLINGHEALEVNGARIFVIGTDNTGFNQHYADLARATNGIPTREGEDLRILLAHDPSYWDYVRQERPDIDLTLSGHTHGGQIGFEFGPIRWSLARMAYPRWAGLYAEPNHASRTPRYLYVNRGLGTVGPPIRVGIRPEITMLTLVRSEEAA